MVMFIENVFFKSGCRGDLAGVGSGELAGTAGQTGVSLLLKAKSSLPGSPPSQFPQHPARHPDFPRQCSLAVFAAVFGECNVGSPCSWSVGSQLSSGASQPLAKQGTHTGICTCVKSVLPVLLSFLKPKIAFQKDYTHMPMPSPNFKAHFKDLAGEEGKNTRENKHKMKHLIPSENRKSQKRLQHCGKFAKNGLKRPIWRGRRHTYLSSKE